ncbi:MAG: DUF4249 domain-containing protein [Spirosoma sp.]|nr:DUF4249 domain-containing protein [Spirosoma sp.]
MRLFIRLLTGLTFAFGLAACIDPEAILLRGTVDIVVVDGTITDLNEPQQIRINRSKADPFTGRFGTRPITKALVEVVVDSAEVVACHETLDGTYQPPTGFRGRVGHAYQLRFTLPDGTRYTSSQQVMPGVPPIDRLTARFNPKSLPPALLGGFTKGFDILIDAQDPAGERNYYRWDWTLYERQYWCKSCVQGYYFPNKLTLLRDLPPVYQVEKEPLEDCITKSDLYRMLDNAFFISDYQCRTPCWEIIRSNTLNLFDDRFTDGGVIVGKSVSQVPYYTQMPALLEVRQLSLTASGYQFFTLFQQQTQNTGGLADTPPTALVGNVKNTANPKENVVGFFTAGAISSVRYWLDKRDAVGVALGSYDEQGEIIPGDQQLFFALNRRKVTPEPGLPFTLGVGLIGGGSRPPTAVCGPIDQRTPFKPEGWRD